MSEGQRQAFFRVVDRGGTIRAAALEVGASPDAAYKWMRTSGFAGRRPTPRVYTAEEKVEFFRLLAEQGNVSAVARQLGFVRITCYKWAHQAGMFTGKSAEAQREEFLRLRAEGLTRTEAAAQVGVDKRSAQDWDKGIRPFYGGRIHPDGTVVRYSSTEVIANVKKPRRSYLSVGEVSIVQLEHRINARFLGLEEREQIHDLRTGGASVRAIARSTGRAASTISRELARNSTDRLGYLPYSAHRLAAARRRRPQPRKLLALGPLRDAVSSGLKRRWSPEQVSRRLAKDYADDTAMRASTETIYQAIYAEGVAALTLTPRWRTRHGRTRRHPRRAPGQRTKRFVEPMRPIKDRPAEVEDRRVAGHWEGDLIVGSLHRSAIATLVDRSTRYTMLVHLSHDHNAETVRDGLIETMSGLPPGLRRTLTWDQGAEMSCHGELATASGMAIYFCDPGSPWQRGTNENTNGLLREYFPKGTDLSRHTIADLQDVADELNHRPRRILNWDTPSERHQAALASI